LVASKKRIIILKIWWQKQKKKKEKEKETQN
jgi:hypothetical protein